MSNIKAEYLRQARAAANPADGLGLDHVLIEMALIEMAETIGLMIERMDRMQAEIDQLKRAA